MNSLNKGGGGVHSENLRIFTNCASNKMDYRQKMVVSNSQKLKHEEDDDEDLETLRLAALNSLRGKQNVRSTRQPALLPRQFKTGVGYPACQVYNSQRPTKRGGYYQNRPSRQNGNTYYPSRVNRNLIEIVPMEDENTSENDASQTNLRIMKSNLQENANTRGESKFYRYKENQSGSDEDDPKEANPTSTEILTIVTSTHSERGDGGDESGTEKDNRSGVDESPCANASNEDVPELAEEEEEREEVPDEEEDEEEEEEEEEEDGENEEEEKPPNDDDDDVLLMADLEEEDSLERLMDEMEREMNVDKQDIKIPEKVTKKDAKESKRINDVPKVRNPKSRPERESDKNGIASVAISTSSLSLLSSSKNERRSVSPRSVNRASQKRRSLSPKVRLRKKSPRRSSPRISKKTFREIPRLRSSPSRFSPRPRSPRLSPRRSSPPSNNRSPQARRSPPLRKLSPRPVSPRSRSPRIRRSRSPRVIPRLRSPKHTNRSKSPRIVRSRSPRASPMKMSPRAKSPRSKSPRISPARRTSPIRRISPRPTTRSPRLSPRRVTPNRQRSPKLSSPDRRRGSPIRLASPVRLSPHRSPWSSPRNSPRLSPRRRKSPKESTRKARHRSLTPDSTPSANYKRETSPLRKTNVSPVTTVSTKGKQKEPSLTIAGPKDCNDAINDPVLEARRRKFESTKPIDPVNDNKKIKLSNKDNTSKKRIEMTEEDIVEHIVDSPKARKSSNKVIEEYDDLPESDLCLTDDYVYEVLEEVASDDASSVNNTVAMCVEMVPVKVEKERSKKKKKRDKELYQVGKLKELPLSERICKEKKCKKRKERIASPVESSPEQTSPIIEDHNVDEEEADLRTELSRRRAERLNRAVPIQSARLLQSAFKGVVNEVAKTNAKVQIQRHAAKGDEKNNKKEVRRVTVLHRTVTDLPNSEDEAIVDSKVPIRFRLGINKSSQESREPKTTRKSSKRSGRKVKHKNNMALVDQERKN